MRPFYGPLFLLRAEGGARRKRGTITWLPGVAAHSMIIEICFCGAAASRAGLPLCGSGPDSVWQ